MNKLSLIIDGNWLFMSRIFGMKNPDPGRLKMTMLQSVTKVLRFFTDIDDVLFVYDQGSWRKDIPIPAGLAAAGEKNNIITEYKGTRDYDVIGHDIEWDKFFNTLEEFCQDLKNAGVKVYKAHGVEGDDWCGYLSGKLNAAGVNCLIWSADKDLQQLVKYNSDGCFTVWWNDRSGLVSEKVDENNVNYFFNPVYTRNCDIYLKITGLCGTVTNITPEHIIISKILYGDISDNILPVAVRILGKNKKYKISKNDIDWDLDYTNNARIETYIRKLYQSNKYRNSIESVNDAVAHALYNRDMVTLSDKYRPGDITENMDAVYNSVNENTGTDKIYTLEEKYYAVINSAGTQKHTGTAGLDSVLEII